jgi:hypothetical protein
MPNTTNYSFPTPADTDLVKNGADAIRDLGDAVDTAMNTALGTKKAGMVLLSSVTFSAVSSQSINDVFSATYKNYLLVSNLTTSANTSLSMRLRVSGADNSTANYGVAYRYNYFNAAGVGDQISAGQTQFNLHISNLNRAANMNMFIFNPQVSANTTISFNNIMADNTSTEFYSFAGGAQFNATTSFTGLTIYTSGVPTITGTVQIYGVNN